MAVQERLREKVKSLVDELRNIIASTRDSVKSCVKFS